jgi:CRP-like cAMP-binding protein
MVVPFPGQDPAFQPGSASSPAPTTFSENLRPVENNHDILGGEPGLPCLGHLKKLFSCKTVRVVPPEHQIYSQGESPHIVCLICSGLVKLTRTESDGNRAIVGLRQAGYMMGAVPSIVNLPYTTTAETITRSKLCLLPTETFINLIDTDAGFSRWILTMLSRRLRSSTLSISEQSCFSGRQRLEKFLWKLAQAQNGGDQNRPIKIQMILKNWEVAQLLSLTPQHLCRLVKQLEREGILMRKNGWVILPDPKKLWHPERAAHELS